MSTGTSKRRAYKVRLWRESPWDQNITYSERTAFQEALVAAEHAAATGGQPVRKVQVMYRDPGSTDWSIYETVWRRGQPAPVRAS